LGTSGTAGYGRGRDVSPLRLLLLLVAEVFLAVFAVCDVAVVPGAGVGEGVGEGFPLAVAAAPPHRRMRSMPSEAGQCGEHQGDGVGVVVVAVRCLVAQGVHAFVLAGPDDAGQLQHAVHPVLQSLPPRACRD
jgi:hypothetical protein